MKRRMPFPMPPKNIKAAAPPLMQKETKRSRLGFLADRSDTAG
jgi:hypothetical protein